MYSTLTFFFVALTMISTSRAYAGDKLDQWLGASPIAEVNGQDLFGSLGIDRNIVLQEYNKDPRTTWSNVVRVNWPPQSFGGYQFSECIRGYCPAGRAQWAVFIKAPDDEYDVYVADAKSDGSDLQYCKISTLKRTYDLPKWLCVEGEALVKASGGTPSLPRGTPEAIAKRLKEVFDAGFKYYLPQPGYSPRCRKVLRTGPMPDGSCCRQFYEEVCD